MTLARRSKRIARANGILMPVEAWAAHKATGVPFYVLCAFLMQETSGGRNIYGHDVDGSGLPKPFYGHGEVTQANYQAYLIERDLGVREADRFPGLGRRMQGVGPLQLTWYSYQDEADVAGGCHLPAVNILTGAKILADKYAIHKARRPNAGEARLWWLAAKSWNGREEYADQIAPTIAAFREALDGV